MKQAGLGLSLKTKRTRKRAFLDEMERVVPWAALVDPITPYALNISDVLTRAKPVAEFVAKYPDQRALIDAAIARTGQPESSLRWLPLVSRRALDWVALIDAKTAEPLGYLHLDGF